MTSIHTPVLLNESIDLLITERSGIYFDGTLGFGGHTQAILNQLSEKGKVVATDVDDDAFIFCKKKFAGNNRIALYKFNFSLVDVIAKIESVKTYNGIIADLGVSSFQLDNPDSGFTYRSDVKLDLRMDKTRTITAADVVNSFSEEDLANILFLYSEEKKSRKIARLIVEKRNTKKILSTGDLSSIVSNVVPELHLGKTLSRVFQALRIYVNDELGNLETFLNKSIDVLISGGRLVLISYHSLEDRIIKDFFREESKSTYDPKVDPFGVQKKVPRLKNILRKPVTPSAEEININKRSRSAKLRVAEKI